MKTLPSVGLLQLYATVYAHARMHSNETHCLRMEIPTNVIRQLSAALESRSMFLATLRDRGNSSLYTFQQRPIILV